MCSTFGVPLLLEVQEDLQQQALDVFTDIPDVVDFVDPDAMRVRIREILKVDE